MGRSRLKILSDILTTIGQSDGGATISQLMRKANLPYLRAINLLAELVRIGLVAEIKEGASSKYLLTQKGYEYLKAYEKFKDFVEAFGLNI